MKIILEYRKEGSHWTSLSTGIQMQLVDSELYHRFFGAREYPLDNTSWACVVTPSGFTLRYRECPQTVSYATLTNLFKTTTVSETEDGIPISNREWRIDPSDVALLTVQEYEACLQGVENAVEYEAILAAANSLRHSLHTVRFFIFK